MNNKSNRPNVLLSLLDNDLGSVSTAMPLLAEGVYEFTVASVKEDKVGDNETPRIACQLKLVQETAPTVDNKQVNKGFPLTHSIWMTPSDQYDPQRELKKFRVGVLGKEGERGSFAPLDQYVGKIVKVKVKVQPESTNKKTGQTYEASNRIQSFLN